MELEEVVEEEEGELICENKSWECMNACVVIETCMNACVVIETRKSNASNSNYGYLSTSSTQRHEPALRPQ